MMSTETTYYPTNDASYPNWPQTHNNMHEKCPNESRVIWTFFFFFLSYGHHPIAPTGHKMHLHLIPMYVSYFVSIFYFTNYYIHID